MKKRLLRISLVCIAVAAGVVISSRARPASFMSEDQQQASDTALAARLAQAQVVVTGTVTAVGEPAAGGPPGLSMHSPQWAPATIAVESVEKGKVPGQSIDVYFSASSDVMWARAPKLSKGQHGLWLLQTGEAAKGAPGAAIVDPLDAHPISDAPKIRSLLKSLPAGK